MKKNIVHLAILLPRVIASLLFGYTTLFVFGSLSASNWYTETAIIILFCLSLLVGAGFVGVDILLHRTRAAFEAGFIAVVIYVLHLISIPGLVIGWSLRHQQHHQNNYDFIGVLLLGSLYIVIVWPLLAGLIFSGREQNTRDIAILCGIAAWTGIFVLVWGFHWEYVGVYLIGGYLIGATLGAFTGIGGWRMRISLERFFAERQEERQWRKTIQQKRDTL